MSRISKPPPPTRYVYVIGPERGLQKVGLATNPRARLAQLQTASPQDLVLHASIPVSFDLALAVERKAHRLLIRTCVRNEWFETTPEQAVAAVEEAARVVLAKAATTPAQSVWRLGRPLRAAYSPPDLGPMLQALAGHRQPDQGMAAGPLFSYGRRAEMSMRVATRYSVGVSGSVPSA